MWLRRAAPILYLLAHLCPAAPALHVLRVTGVIQPLHSFMVQVPLIKGRSGQITLTRLVSNGVQVRPRVLQFLGPITF
jgi:hypothetical protein